MERVLLAFSLLGVTPAVAQGPACSFLLVSSQTNSSGVERSDSVTYSFNGPNVAMRIHGRGGQPDVRMIFDPTAKTITQLHEINGRKGGFVFAMTETRWPGMAYATAKAEAGTSEFTGNTRTIQGHACKETKAENAQYTALVCVAEDIPLSMLRVFSYQSVGAGKSTEEADLLSEMSLSGFPLEMLLNSKSGKPDVVIRVVDFRNEADTALFDQQGYSTTWVGE